MKEIDEEIDDRRRKRIEYDRRKLINHEMLPRETLVRQTEKHTATLFLFHGSGSNAEDFKQWLDIINTCQLRFPYIKIIYVSAPIQPFNLKGGTPSQVWFDREAISIKVPEMKHSIDVTCSKISELMHKELWSGIPANRIVVGGFSMGACLAMHMAYRINRSLAGCIVMSNFLNDRSSVYETLASTDAKSEPNWPKLLQFHGTDDKIVPIEWGKKTFDNLQKLKVQGTFVPLQGANHEVVKSELDYVKNWLSNLLPAIELEEKRLFYSKQ